MKRILQLEEAALFGLSIYFFNQTHFDWWWYIALILTPDVGMIGYAFNTTIGAYTYNLFHHKGLGIVLLILGWSLAIPWVELTGIIIIGHAALDRVLGYGLKYTDSFKHTHLGQIGKN
ncbi:DUF4260 domain-containing protein [Marinoscillum sp. MHG1-6]|uniref:DUF4260 domain-containing protein n=1 Tax=Marinoscillum sp. MHG1-6 TaxID=2959627 RepID=UPI0021586AC4|nr:DUF4260 domain-containing protein [Marinoscillum sp. MHG1-6]